MNYYVFEHITRPVTFATMIGKWSGRETWFYGLRRVPWPAEDMPVEFSLDQPGEGPGTPISAGYVSCPCLFSDELLEVLYRAGVDNLDVFPALLHDNRTEGASVVYKNYKAVKILGHVACVDRRRSGEVDLGDSTGLLKGGVERMYIDEAKTHGLPMFRPVPGVGAVIVNERVKSSIEASGLKHFRFYNPSEWGGF